MTFLRAISTLQFPAPAQVERMSAFKKTVDIGWMNCSLAGSAWANQTSMYLWGFDYW